ncbi:MAG TPA: ABC transporter permease [Anaerolineales bacterium]|nr:ABC transporter permease [Anaerolineales bacterium]HJO90644.1 ABC transporter permease [Anaerolineales bacterium]
MDTVESRRTLNINPSFVIGISILIVWIVIAIFADQISPYNPIKTVAGAREAPSASFLFGTDRLGRDVLSRVMHGSRISLMLGLISVLIGAIVGTLFGILSGYYGGLIDTIIMRITDAMLAFPGILLALVVIASLGTGIIKVMIAVGISTIPIYARLIRSTVLTVREQPYIDAATLLGVRDIVIMYRHVLPNTLAPLIVLSTLQVGNAITIGAGLSFLGMGAQPPDAEWGLMAATGRAVLGKAWWISTFPGIAILTAVMACNLLGDSLRRTIDPRIRLR